MTSGPGAQLVDNRGLSLAFVGNMILVGKVVKGASHDVLTETLEMIIQEAVNSDGKRGIAYSCAPIAYLASLREFSLKLAFDVRPLSALAPSEVSRIVAAYDEGLERRRKVALKSDGIRLVTPGETQ